MDKMIDALATHGYYIWMIFFLNKKWLNYETAFQVTGKKRVLVVMTM